MVIVGVAVTMNVTVTVAVAVALVLPLPLAPPAPVAVSLNLSSIRLNPLVDSHLRTPSSEARSRTLQRENADEQKTPSHHQLSPTHT